ncbi:DNA-binding protein [Bacillus cytotoxicus]|uniref:DNA-binding protein n=1 Tax=Bacillus cytotoxicus TaxID=580165 RepID=UPI00086414E3|nr:DNA-binding protein [Bacillus cytotoxicus]AWC27570.1 DNA-binding protein [Bacillus cytotoxicus]AWC41055.1 DNA-binding protein [Bacillus cytotoxicus]AWC48986.1 DNA-binding protein [Bacillus cytotoxicus]AWC51636.1 DNA-binding protein [Bacillus cytotoxicus]AWC55765.1 DNA-binding protein [Bacillus cytotoxicus]
MKNKKRLILSLAATITLTTGSAYLPSAFAESSTDPAPEITAKVINQNNGKKVLFDNTHGQTAGTADWVIDGGFSDFGNGIANNGYFVKELRQSNPITYETLKDYNVFIVPEANIPYKKSEQDAMLQYVKNGGSIFFIADHYNADRNKNRWDSSEVFNGYRRGAWENAAKGMSTEEETSLAMQGVESSDWLSQNFGIRFRYNALGDITATNIVSPNQSFGITAGVSSVAMHAGSTLAITNPKLAKGIVYLPENPPKWNHAVDSGVYNGGGIAEGPYVAIAKVGLGKAAFIGDSSPVEDATPKYVREDTGQPKKTYDGYKEQNDAILLENIVNWLSHQETYTSLDQISGLQLDEPTPLQTFEQPSLSTEPQPEPWSAPTQGYQWFNTDTFKPGSYGYKGSIATPVHNYVVTHPSVLPNNEVFQIKIQVNNLLPNTTYNNYSLGIFIAGGTQVAKVQNSNGTWPSTYGYSNAFSFTTNSQGSAEKVVNVQISPNTIGQATLRLRQNSIAKYSEPVTIHAN